MKNSTYLILLFLTIIGVTIFLGANHAYVPMWVEGPIFEQIQDYFVLLGFDQSRPTCWLAIQGRSFPMSYHAYHGIAFYAHLPFVYLWMNGMTSDPYIYRYLGIALLSINSFLMYVLIRLHAPPRLAFFGALIYLTTPTLLFTSLTEHQVFTFYQFVLLIAAILFTLYRRHPSLIRLFAFSFSVGVILLTRLEVLLWPLFAALLFISLLYMASATSVGQARFNLKSLLVALVGFCLGAAPTLAYHATCQSSNIITVLRTKILPNSASLSTSLGNKVGIRVQQFFDHNLLHRQPLYEMLTPNIVFALIWIVAAITLLRVAIRSKRPDFLLLVVLTAIPLSIMTTGNPRYEHLTFLQLFVILIVISAAVRWERGRLKAVTSLVLLIVVMGNLIVAWLDWSNWVSSSNRQTMLNQSDPMLLSNYLMDRHEGDHLLYTNVGMSQYLLYMTAGRMKGEDIINWTEPSAFVNAVRTSLLNTRQRRVFVSVADVRDGQGGALARTRLLYEALNQSGVSFTKTTLSNSRNPFIYDIVVVEPGIAPSSPNTHRGFVVSSIDDVRVSQGQLIGSIHGSNLERGDVVVVNDQLTVPTAYGSSTWLSFAIPLEGLATGETIALKLVRPGTFESSRPHTLTIPR